MEKFTLFYRSIDCGYTGFAHVEGEDLASVGAAFEEEYPNVDLIGAVEGYATILWWEE